MFCDGQDPVKGSEQYNITGGKERIGENVQL
jgi:hypothetical protein